MEEKIFYLNGVRGRATVAIYCVNIYFKEFARHYIEGAQLVKPFSPAQAPRSCPQGV